MADGRLTRSVILKMARHSMVISDIIGVSQEAFALFTLENSFLRWSWIAGEIDRTKSSKVRGGERAVAVSKDPIREEYEEEEASSQESVEATSDDGVATTRRVKREPPNLYQSMHFTSNNTCTLGHFTNEGFKRFNDIIKLVVEKRSKRGNFEDLLRKHFTDKNVKAGVISGKRERDNDGSNDDNKRVQVLDLFDVEAV